MVPGPVGEAPLVAAVLVVEVLRQLLDHLELPGLVLVVAVTNSRLDDIFVHRARRREAEVALEVVLRHLEVGVVLGRVHVEDVLRVPGRRATRLEDEALAGGGRRRGGRGVTPRPEPRVEEDDVALKKKPGGVSH